MGSLDTAVSLVTLASLFILGPALGHAVVSCFNWQNWPIPIQHFVVAVCTMVAVTGLIFAYGALWQLSPKSVAWYGWMHELPAAGNAIEPVPARRQKGDAKR